MENNQLSILNRNVMKELIGDDTEMIRGFEIEFLKQAKVSMAKFAVQYQANEFTAMKEEAHFLKTSAKAVGAEKLGEILQQMEAIAFSKDKAQCKTQIMEINKAIKEVYGVIVNER